MTKMCFAKMGGCFSVELAVLVVAWACWAESEVVPPGFSRTYEYDKPSRVPIVFGGWSKAENAEADEFFIAIDVHYDSGKKTRRRIMCMPGTHDWQKESEAFGPVYPVKKIVLQAVYRNWEGRGNPGGHVEFRDVFLERKTGKGESVLVNVITDRPFSNADECRYDVFRDLTVQRQKRLVPRTDAMTSPVESGKVEIWTADSMTLVTPLTFPQTNSPRAVSIALAKRERESAQVLLSSAADVEWSAAELEMPVLKSADGAIFKGTVTWQRQGYLARECGMFPHPHSFPRNEKWFPDPLLPPAPMRVRKASTQGTWITVWADPGAVTGVYTGEVLVKERGEVRGRVPVRVKVEAFSLPKTFGLETAFSLMDGFLRMFYPDELKKKRREAIDIMLDHRLNPDDISRTTPPDIDDLLHARERGMNRFNILNVVPPPTDPNAYWVLTAKPEEIFSEDFYSYFIGIVKPYVRKLREHGLDRLAYVYGFDERRAKYYPGMDDFWKKLQRDVPGVPLMTTAFNFSDYATGKTNVQGVVAGDWFCPMTMSYDIEAADRLRAMGRKVWWYVCMCPRYPYANFASWEYPIVEGRLLGWMTWRWRADGFLFWIVNKWNNDMIRFKEEDTYFPDCRTFNANGMPGDGVMMYPGERHILPSIRLAQCRDAEEDYEYLQIAAEKVGRKRTDAVCDVFIKSLTDFSRNPQMVRAARRKLVRLINDE